MVLGQALYFFSNSKSCQFPPLILFVSRLFNPINISCFDTFEFKTKKTRVKLVLNFPIHNLSWRFNIANGAKKF